MMFIFMANMEKKEFAKQKTIKEIKEHIKEAIPRGVNKFYLNGLLWCLGRDDLGISFDERMTEKRVNKILGELEKSRKCQNKKIKQ